MHATFSMWSIWQGVYTIRSACTAQLACSRNLLKTSNAPHTNKHTHTLRIFVRDSGAQCQLTVCACMYLYICLRNIISARVSILATGWQRLKLASDNLCVHPPSENRQYYASFCSYYYLTPYVLEMTTI